MGHSMLWNHLMSSGSMKEVALYFMHPPVFPVGSWGSIVVKALCYKSVGPGFDSKR